MAKDGDSSKSRISILAAGLIVLVGGAVYWGLRPRAESGQIATPESAVTYLCVEDGTLLNVTPADFERFYEKGQVRSTGSGQEADVVSLACSKCGKFTAVRAEQCTNDQTWFPRRTLDGRAGKCPKCGWAFYKR